MFQPFIDEECYIVLRADYKKQFNAKLKKLMDKVFKIFFTYLMFYCEFYFIIIVSS